VRKGNRDRRDSLPLLLVGSPALQISKSGVKAAAAHEDSEDSEELLEMLQKHTDCTPNFAELNISEVSMMEETAVVK